MRAVKSVSIDSERRVITTFLDGSTETLYPNLIYGDAEVIKPGLSDEVKIALLACFEHVAWVDENGQDYYDALETALYPSYPSGSIVSIKAVYTQSGTVYNTNTLDSLKSDLIVTAYYDNSTTAVISNYTLSGTLNIGVSTITVSYSGKTDTFNVTVTKDTEVQIAQSNYALVLSAGRPNAHPEPLENAGITIKYTLSTPTTVLYPAGIIVHDNLFRSNIGCLTTYNNDTYVNYVDEINRWAQSPSSPTEFRKSWNIETYNQIEFSIDLRYIDDSYMYDYTTGDIWFAGKNTPYFGMSNISESQ